MSERSERYLAERSAAGYGIVTRGELLAGGVGRGEIQRRLRAGLLVPYHTGVYRHAAVPPSSRATLLAAVRACGTGAVASHRSAARLWALRGVPLRGPEVVVRGPRLPLRSGVLVHRSLTLAPEDVSVVDGIPVTAVPRTLFDLGAVVPFEAVELAAQDAIVRSLTSNLDLVCTLERLGGRGRRGTVTLRAVVEARLPPEEIESHLEVRLLQLIRLARVPEPELQWETTVADGRRVRFDFAWPEHRIAVEADGRRWHATRQDFERDLVRRRAVAAAGWTLHAFGWTDVHQRPAAVRRDITALLTGTEAA